MRIAVVTSRYHSTIAAGLEAGVTEYLVGEAGLPAEDIEWIEAAGAFELPLIAQAAARTGRFAGVIALGCVLRGDTAHFDYVCDGAAGGLMQAQLATGVPMAFGVLTADTVQQARARARVGDAGNKGREAAAACWASIRTLRTLAAGAPNR